MGRHLLHTACGFFVLVVWCGHSWPDQPKRRQAVSVWVQVGFSTTRSHSTMPFICLTSSCRRCDRRRWIRSTVRMWFASITLKPNDATFIIQSLRTLSKITILSAPIRDSKAKSGWPRLIDIHTTPRMRMGRAHPSITVAQPSIFPDQVKAGDALRTSIQKAKRITAPRRWIRRWWWWWWWWHGRNGRHGRYGRNGGGMGVEWVA